MIPEYERIPALPPITIRHNVDAGFYASGAEVKVFQAEELVATKIRAMYQRSKGRDLFDLWLALETLCLEPAKIIEAFEPYRPEGITAALMIRNLERKLESRQFLEDLSGLVVSKEINYQHRIAANLVIDKLIKLIN